MKLNFWFINLAVNTVIYLLGASFQNFILKMIVRYNNLVGKAIEMHF